jgi:hypothetical protein
VEDIKFTGIFWKDDKLSLSLNAKMIDIKPKQGIKGVN